MKPQPPREINKPSPGGWGEPPFTWAGEDYAGRIIRIDIDFNQTTGELTDATTNRDDGCLFDRILFGVGEDGSPDSAPKKIICQVGTRNVPKGQLHAVGLDNMADVLAGQITCGRPPGQ